MKDYFKLLSANIAKYRKQNGLTQDALAEKLGVSFQAVSKWENEQCCPDILLLPQLSEIFGISIDELFDIDRASAYKKLPWKDDETLHGVVFKGHNLLSETEKLSKFTFSYTGDALNVSSNCSIECQSVAGNATAGGYIECGDVGGDAASGSYMECGDIGGAAASGSYMECGDIGGNATASGNIEASDINGDVKCGGDLSCSTINGFIK